MVGETDRGGGGGTKHEAMVGCGGRGRGRGTDRGGWDDGLKKANCGTGVWRMMEKQRYLGI
jgi:hypothetical protein